MEVLFLNPPYVKDFCRSSRWVSRSRGRVQRHPDWMLIAAAILEKAGNKVKFIDGSALNLSAKGVERELVAFKPQIAVLHTTTPSIYSDIEYAKMVKQKTGAITVLIGPHVTAEPEDTFRISGGSIDFIARGEYDYILRDLTKGLSCESIPGISYLRNGVVRHNPEGELVNVNDLPPPAWRHVKPEWYFDGGKRFPFLTLISARGCFGECTFCRDTPLLYKHKLRLRPAKQVVDEIEYDYRLFPYIKEIMFETDTFTASAEHVQGICEEILKRNLKVCWSCNTRVDMDLTLLPLMKKSGCRMLMSGFEFGTQSALEAVRKKITIGQSKAFCQAAKRLGFTIHGCFMFGAPGETKESCQQTIELAKSLSLDTAQFSGISAYPGTEIYQWAKKNGFLVPQDWRQWVTKDFEQASVLSYPDLTNEDINLFINKGLKEFYLRPAQIWRIISKSSWNDLSRLYFGLKSFLKTCLKSG